MASVDLEFQYETDPKAPQDSGICQVTGRSVGDGDRHEVYARACIDGINQFLALRKGLRPWEHVRLSLLGCWRNVVAKNEEFVVVRTLVKNTNRWDKDVFLYGVQASESPDRAGVEAVLKSLGSRIDFMI